VSQAEQAEVAVAQQVDHTDQVIMAEPHQGRQQALEVEEAAASEDPE
jgi:hypothetical protein